MSPTSKGLAARIAWLRQGRRRSPNPTGPFLTLPFLVILLVTFLGFALEHVLRPVIPLIIVDRGGNALVIGIVATIHSLPSVLFRPLIGALVDSGRQRSMFRLGAIVAAVSPWGVLLPGTVLLGAVRFVQGSAWAVYAVTTRTLMARMAPNGRRGEASGYYAAMPALAMLIAPSAGVALYITTGEVGPVVVASALGLATLALAGRIAIRTAVAEPATATPKGRTSVWGRIVERSALPPTLMVTTFLAAQTIFTVFPPLYVVGIGVGVETLAVYYPIYGLTMVLSQIFSGRLSDRIGRGNATRLGCTIAAVGLATAAFGDGLFTFSLGAAAYAVAVAMVIPTMSAMAIDRAPEARLGSAMATYSIGYQFATGASSLAWGALIALADFKAAFVAAIAFQAITFLLSLKFSRHS